MKIQPIDSEAYRESVLNDAAPKPVLKSRLKRIFGISSTDKVYLSEKETEFDPSSVCLVNMVTNFIEEENDKQSVTKCGRTRCNCFHGNNTYSSDDDEFLHCNDYEEIYDSLKSLVSCTSISERNLLADISKIVDKNKQLKKKTEVISLVAESIQALGYDSSICKSRWEKSSFYPSGEYEYIDTIIEQERLIIDVDFRSEFEIARPTTNYKTILQLLPIIFIGKADRIGQIVDIVSEAAKMSLKKRGMHIPPWRKSEYISGKWLSPHTRNNTPQNQNDVVKESPVVGDFDLIFGEKTSSFDKKSEVLPWQPPEVKHRIVNGRKIAIAFAK